MAELNGEERVLVLRKAIALYLDCDEEEVGNFVFGCERQVGENVMFSGGWSGIAHWYSIGMVDELRSMLEKQRVPQPSEIQTVTPLDAEALLRGER